MSKQSAHFFRSVNARPGRRQFRQAASGLATASVFAVGLPAPIALAGTGSCTGSGAIEVSDDRTVECGLLSGDSLTVTGSIRVDNTGLNPEGVRVGNGVSGVQIINRGTIESGTSNGISNEGAITSITNHGTIRGGRDGFFFGYGVYNTGSIGVLDNKAGATIAADPSDYAIWSSGVLDTLDNAGLIDGAIEASNTTINLRGSSASITGRSTTPA